MQGERGAGDDADQNNKRFVITVGMAGAENKKAGPQAGFAR